MVNIIRQPCDEGVIRAAPRQSPCTRDQAGIASGINNAVARTAGLLAIAIFGLVVFHTFNAALDTRLAQLQIPSEVQQLLAPQRSKLAGAEVPAGLSEPFRMVLKQAIAESFISSFRLIMLTASGLAITSAIVAALMIESRIDAS